MSYETPMHLASRSMLFFMSLRCHVLQRVEHSPSKKTRPCPKTQTYKTCNHMTTDGWDNISVFSMKHFLCPSLCLNINWRDIQRKNVADKADKVMFKATKIKWTVQNTHSTTRLTQIYKPIQFLLSTYFLYLI